MHVLLATSRALVLIIWTIVLLPLTFFSQVALGRTWTAGICLWHRYACHIIGLDISMTGRPSTGAPKLFVANHVSYIDILALGSQVKVRFIAKADVSGWPVFGFLARLCGTVFIQRRAGRSGHQRDLLKTLLASGESLVLFAEGTSSDGRTVQPFKSSLFGALEAKALRERVDVQPVTIGYETPTYAWYGDMTLMPHLWRLLGLRGGRVYIRWHDVVQADQWTDRKDLARQLQRIVTDGLLDLPIDRTLCGDQVTETMRRQDVERARGVRPD